jgi:hypothetical protein
MTVTGTTTAGYLTVWPAGQTRPLASNLNWTAGETIPNLVQVAVGASGQVSVFNSTGSTNVVMDVEGYVAPDPVTTAGLFFPLQPYRVCDTRRGNPSGLAGLDAQCLGKTLGPGGTLTAHVTGTNPSGLTSGGVPPSGVSAVVLNVTVTGTTTAGYLTVWPTDRTRPLASNLNWTAGETTPNRVVVPVSGSGDVSVFNSTGSTDVVIDVGGYYGVAGGVGSYFNGVSPTRICDTRLGNPSRLSGPEAQCNSKTLGPATTLTVNVAGVGPVPSESSTSTPPAAVVLNVTVTHTTTPGYLTVWPTGDSRPTSSDLNWKAGETVPNLVVATLGTGGQVQVFNDVGGADVVVDVVGYLSGANVLPPTTIPLSTASLAMLGAIGVGDSELDFTGTDGQLLGLVPGDIVTSGPDSLAPTGLLLRVVSVSPQAGGGLDVATAQASLTEAAPQGEFQVAGSTVNGLNPPSTLGLGSAATRSRALAPASTANAGTPSGFLQNFSCGGSFAIDYSGGFTKFSVTPIFNATWSWGLPPSITISASLRLDETYASSMTLTAGTNVSCTKSFPLPFNNMLLSDPFPVDLGPVTFTVTPVLQASIAFTAGGNFTGGPTFDATQSQFVEAGAQYSTSSGFSPVGGIGCDPPVPAGTPLCVAYGPKSNADIGGQGTISAGLNTAVVAAIDALPIDCGTPELPAACKVIGPIFGPEVFANLTAQFQIQTAAPIWALQFNLTMGVGFTFNWQVGPIGLNLNFQVNLVNTNWVLAHAIEIDSKGQLPNAEVGQRYNSEALEASGVGTPPTWGEGTGWPSWLSINPTSGVISGIPPASVANTTVSVPVQATDSTPLHITATQALQIPVGVPPLAIDTTVPDATASKAYTTDLQANGGVPGYSWALQAGSSLPLWLSLTSSGALSGTPPPTAAGSMLAIPIQVTDSNLSPGPDTIKATISLNVVVPTMKWGPLTAPQFYLLDTNDISCPAPGTCLAVSRASNGADNPNDAGTVSVYTDGAWSQPSVIDDNAGVQAISCPTMTFCMAIDSAGKAISYQDGSWSGPISTGLGWYDPRISCPSAQFCTAISANATGGFAVTYTNGAWQSPVTLSATAGVNGIACPASNACWAVGNNGDAYQLTVSGWKGPMDIDGTTNLTAVSCPTTTFCVASDAAGNVLTYLNGTWSSPKNLTSTALGHVSCPSANSCVATASTYSSVGLYYTFQTFVYQSGTWTTGNGISVPYLAGHYGVAALSCPTVSFCEVDLGYSEVGTYDAGSWSVTPIGLSDYSSGVTCVPGTQDCLYMDESGEVAWLDNGVWADPQSADPAGSASYASCPTIDFCMLVDIQGNAVTYVSGKWTTPVNVDATVNVSLDSVSCPDPTFCIAVDSNGNAFTYTNGTWSQATNIDGTNYVSDISCPTDNFCVAVDANGYAITYQQGVWSAPVQISPSTVARSPSVSCASPAFCVSIDSSGYELTYTSGTWAAPQQVGAGSGWPGGGVSCPSTDQCVATDGISLPYPAIDYYYGHWSSPIAVNDYAFLAYISCPSPNYCAGAAGANRGFYGSTATP